MADILQFDDVVNRAQELETYITQYQVALKALHAMKEEADKIVGTLHQKKDELSRHEQDLVEYLKKLQLVSQKADALLTPIVDQKKELETLGNKLEEGIAGIDGIVDQRLKTVVEPLQAKLQELEAGLGTATAELRKDVETTVADLGRKQDELVKDLSERIEGSENVARSHTTALEAQNKAAEQARKNAAELQKVLQDLKGVVEKQRQEFKGLMERQHEELKSLLAKQKEEESALVEQRRKELSDMIGELSEKRIKVLEKDDAQLKSTLNAVIAKLGNVKFKKILGL
jgi:chromosome segregation ATPase